MRKTIILILLLVSGISAGAQNLRTVKGVTADSKGQPVPNVTLKVDGVDKEFHSSRVGQFEINVPLSSKSMTAYSDGYAVVKVDISSQFVIVRLWKAEADAAPVQTPVPAPVQPSPVQQEQQIQPVQQVQPASEQQAEPSAPEQTEPSSGQQTKPGCTYHKGFYNTFDISYAYSFNRGRAVFTNLGEMNYDTMHPIELSYSLGYKFSDLFTLFAGAGFLYNVRYVDWRDTLDETTYADFVARRWDIPVYLGIKLAFGKSGVKPFILAQGGAYLMSTLDTGTFVPDFELGAGIAVGVGGRNAVNVTFTARNLAWPHLSVNTFKGYPITIAPSVKVGFSF